MRWVGLYNLHNDGLWVEIGYGATFASDHVELGGDVIHVYKNMW